MGGLCRSGRFAERFVAVGSAVVADKAGVSAVNEVFGDSAVLASDLFCIHDYILQTVRACVNLYLEDF